MANYNVSKMITSGREIMANNPKRDLTLIDVSRILDSTPDTYFQIEHAFLFGVAVGVRISKAEQMKEVNNG